MKYLLNIVALDPSNVWIRWTSVDVVKRCPLFVQRPVNCEKEKKKAKILNIDNQPFKISPLFIEETPTMSYVPPQTMPGNYYYCIFMSFVVHIIITSVLTCL